MFHNPRCGGVKQAQQKTKELVSKFGWSVMGVLGDKKSPSFSYTIGLHSHGLPELIVFCLPHDLAQAILNDVARLMIKNKKPYLSGSNIDGIANLPVAVVDALRGKEEYTVQAYNFYTTWSYNLQQLVIPDPQGLFPWDSDHNHELMKYQPQLYSVDIIRHKLSSSE